MELVSLRSRMKIHELTEDESPRCRAHAGLAEAVLDPYVNAVHVTLLREKQLNPVYAEHFARLGAGSDAVRELGEKLLAGGPDKLKAVRAHGGAGRPRRDGVAAPASVAAPGGKTRAVVEGDDPRIQPPGMIGAAILDIRAGCR